MPVDEHQFPRSAEAGAGPAESPRLVRVRFWASARAAAGTPHASIPVTGPTTVAELRELVLEALPGRAGLERVLGVCSVLVGEEPVHDAAAVVQPGDTVEFLPPFAGG